MSRQSTSNFARALATILVVAGCFASFSGAKALADELEQLFRQVLIDPHDIDANFAYARAALAQGEIGQAIAAYERILEVDPNNEAARVALRRTRVSLIPTSTSGQIEIGGRYETNVQQLPRREEDDFVGFATLLVEDRRALFEQDWRSTVYGYGDLHDESSEIDFWYGRGHTGPVFELSGDTSVQIAPGGAVAFVDAEWYYLEPAVHVIFRNLFGGLLSRLDFRGAYRDINNDVGASEGFAFDVVGRNITRELLTPQDVLILQPFFRIRESDTQPSGLAPFLISNFVLGDYLEFGGRAMYFVQAAENLRLGMNFYGYYRDYQQTVRLGTEERDDYFISPGAEILFQNVACSGCDIKFEYRYEQNFSNDDTEDFDNHVFSLSAIKRF